MTEHHGSERVERTSAQGPPKRSWWAVLAPAAALLVGILIGGVVVGVADDDEAPSAEPQPTSSPTAGNASESPAKDGTTAVVVPQECLAAVDTAEEATALIRQGAGAIRDFQPKKLRSLLTRLEELDQQAREQAQACRDVQVERSPTQD